MRQHFNEGGDCENLLAKGSDTTIKDVRGSFLAWIMQKNKATTITYYFMGKFLK